MSNIYTRCIHIFPRFKESEKINNLRKKYDYLHDSIEPHITLVFPFESSLSAEAIISDLEERLSDVNTFQITTSDLIGVEKHGYYMFLNIDEGNEIISDLHYKFHEGILKPYQSEWTKDGSFLPHITVGRFNDRTEMENAVLESGDYRETYTTTVDRFYIEIIGDNDESIIDGIIKLKNDN